MSAFDAHGIRNTEPPHRPVPLGHNAMQHDLDLIDGFVSGIQRDAEAAIRQRLGVLLTHLHSDKARDEARRCVARIETWCDELEGDLRHWVERDREAEHG